MRGVNTVADDETTAADPTGDAGRRGRRGRGGRRRADRGPRPPVDRVQAVLALVIGLSLVGVLFGFSIATTGADREEARDPVVERLFPSSGDLVLRQSTVGADLAFGYRGYLIIDGQEIPTYDVTSDDAAAPGASVNQTYDARFDRNQGTVLFTPTVGATVEKFAPGPHRITIVYWREGIETRDQARSYSWEFKVS
jgi:hypothetical protein